MTPRETPKELFLALSAALTGIAVSSFRPRTDALPALPAKPGDLAPRNTPIDLAQLYLDTLHAEVGAEQVDALLARFAKMKATDGEAKAAHSVHADPQLGDLCRSIMKLWYLGVWYSPHLPGTPVRVVSTQAYKEGLVWKVMQSHPIGYSMWTFGYWHEAPPKLEQFLSVMP